MHATSPTTAGATQRIVVFQQYSLYPHLTVFDNLAFPLRAPARRIPESEIKRRWRKWLASSESITAGELRNTTLGGECREWPSVAPWYTPAIYLMDEPLSSLDAKLRAELRVELKHIQADLGATVLYVTHDQVEALTMASRIGFSSRAPHPGRYAAGRLRATREHLRSRTTGHPDD